VKRYLYGLATIKASTNPEFLNLLLSFVTSCIIDSNFPISRRSIPFSSSSGSLSPQPGPSSLVIPVIPEIDDIDIPLEIENLKISSNTTKENYVELNQQDFNLLEDIDLSILTRFLRPAKELPEEKDEVWTIDSITTSIFTEINAENAKK
jgi:Intraflagellar transport protein 43